MTTLYRTDAAWQASSFFPMAKSYVLAARAWVSICLGFLSNEVNILSKGLAVMEIPIGRLDNPSQTIQF